MDTETVEGLKLFAAAVVIVPSFWIIGAAIKASVNLWKMSRSGSLPKEND